MGYKYQNICLETIDDYYLAFAQECTGNFVTSGSTVGNVTKCTPVTGGVNIRLYSLSTGNPTGVDTFLTPPSISCTYSSSPGSLPIEDIVALSWLVAGVWVVAWGVKKIIQVIKQR